ncbi:MAG: 3'-5' exonuclease [Holophagaceae bacterium]|nr:3'-5' exonuclease [Holophagaceae bacterium]
MTLSNTYLFLDTETGGLDPRSHSLLSLGLVVGDASGIQDSLEILVKHEPYVVSGGGMKVNRIDLARHHETALSPADVLNQLDDFLNRHFPEKARVTLVGHNVAFDQAFLSEFLLAAGRDPEGRFHHRIVDTHSIASALREAGKLDLQRLSSDSLFDYFGIQVPPEKRHTALGDSLATFELYWKLVGLCR